MENSAGTSNENGSEISVDSNIVSKLRLAAKNDNSEKIKELLYEGKDKEALENVTSDNLTKIKEFLDILDKRVIVAHLRAALCQCVAENDPESVVVLLLCTYEKPEKDDFRNSCITPTINLAAQLGHYEIIDEIAHFLIQSGYVTGDFPEAFSDFKQKSSGDNGKSDEVEKIFKEVMLRSQIAISSFRVLSSPVHMSLSYLKDEEKKEEKEEGKKETNKKTEDEKDGQNQEKKDGQNQEEKDGQNQEEKDGQNQEEKDGQNQEEKPEEKGKKSKQKQNLLTQAYALHEKIEKRAKDEPEFKKEYRHLSKRCKTFVTDLYKSCVNMEEIMALLDVDKKQFKEDMQGTVKDIFQKAIENNHKEFVAHPNSQQLLNVAIYSGVPKQIRTITSIPINTQLFIVYTLFFPLLALWHNFYPAGNWLSKMMETSYLKFVSHVSQFVVFLIMVAASALRSSHIPSGLGKNIAFSLPKIEQGPIKIVENARHGLV